MCLDLDAISSGDSGSGSSALHAGLVSIVDHRSCWSGVDSDSDQDSWDERCQSQSPIALLSRVSASISFLVVESPSYYQAPAEPIVLSAVSSILISPNREDCSSMTLDAYPVYEVSPDTTGLRR